MKKILVILLIIILSIFALSGCAKAKSPSAIWRDYENFTYDVVENVDDIPNNIGTLVMSVERISSVDISIGEYSYTAFTGFKISYTLNVKENDTENSTIVAHSYITTKFLPMLSYKKTSIYDKEKNERLENESFSKYDGTSYIYKYNGNENSITVKGALMDNESMFIILRSYDLAFKTFSTTFKVPSPIQNMAQEMTAKSMGEKELSPPILQDTSINCLRVDISLNSKYTGTITTYYSKEPLVINLNNKEMKFDKALIQFTSENITYKLKSATYDF